MLEPQEQTLLAFLAVFAGGRSLDAVEAVCGPDLTIDVLDGLQSLTDKSLIRQATGSGGGPRFFLLETIHEYARELFNKEPDTETIRQRHCDYFVEVAERAAPQLYGAASDHWMDILNADLDNLRAALAFSEGNPLQGCRLLGALQRFWYSEGHLGVVEAWERQALEHIGALDGIVPAHVYLAVGRAAYGRQQILKARAFHSNALDLSQKAADKAMTAQAMMLLAASYSGDTEQYDRAISLSRGALDLARAIDNEGLILNGLNLLGELARSHGDDQVAAQAYEECLQLSEEIGDKRRATIQAFNLAFLAEHRRDYEAAQQLAAEGLRAAWEMEHRANIGMGLGAVALAAIAAGRFQRGARLLNAADRALEVIGYVLQPPDQPEYDRARTTLAQQLTAAELGALMAEGQAMTLPEAVAYALKENAPTPYPLPPMTPPTMTETAGARRSRDLRSRKPSRTESWFSCACVDWPCSPPFCAASEAVSIESICQARRKAPRGPVPPS